MRPITQMAAASLLMLEHGEFKLKIWQSARCLNRRSGSTP